jgi:hypothetical protein
LQFTFSISANYLTFRKKPIAHDSGDATVRAEIDGNPYRIDDKLEICGKFDRNVAPVDGAVSAFLETC